MKIVCFLKKIIIILVALLLLILTLSYLVEHSKSCPDKISSKVIGKPTKSDMLFAVGREFVLRVYYMGAIPVATASFNVEEKKDNSIYLLSANAQLTDFLNNLYPVSARIESLMNTKKLHSLKYTEKTTTPEKTKTKEITYDQDNNIATRQDVKVKILPNTQDPLSVVFCLLSQDFNLNESFSLNLVSKEENYEFKVDVLEKKGKIWKLKILVARQDRSSSHGGTFYVWVHEDGFKIPILLRAWTKVGLVTARLTGVK